MASNLTRDEIVDKWMKQSYSQMNILFRSMKALGMDLNDPEVKQQYGFRFEKFQSAISRIESDSEDEEIKNKYPKQLEEFRSDNSQFESKSKPDITRDFAEQANKLSDTLVNYKGGSTPKNAWADASTGVALEFKLMNEGYHEPRRGLNNELIKNGHEPMNEYEDAMMAAQISKWTIADNQPLAVEVMNNLNAYTQDNRYSFDQARSLLLQANQGLDYKVVNVANSRNSDLVESSLNTSKELMALGKANVIAGMDTDNPNVILNGRNYHKDNNGWHSLQSGYQGNEIRLNLDKERSMQLDGVLALEASNRIALHNKDEFVTNYMSLGEPELQKDLLNNYAITDLASKSNHATQLYNPADNPLPEPVEVPEAATRYILSSEETDHLVMAKLSYESPEFIQGYGDVNGYQYDVELSKKLENELNDNKDFETVGFQAAIFHNPETNKYEISCAGTQDLTDVIQDVNFVTGDYGANPNSMTQQAMAVEYVAHALSELKQRGVPLDNIQLSGHSLGGGNLQLAADAFGLKGQVWNSAATENIRENPEFVEHVNKLLVDYKLDITDYARPGQGSLIAHRELGDLVSDEKFLLGQHVGVDETHFYDNKRGGPDSANELIAQTTLLNSTLGSVVAGAYLTSQLHQGLIRNHGSDVFYGSVEKERLAEIKSKMSVASSIEAMDKGEAHVISGLDTTTPAINQNGERYRKDEDGWHRLESGTQGHDIEINVDRTRSMQLDGILAVEASNRLALTNKDEFVASYVSMGEPELQQDMLNNYAMATSQSDEQRRFEEKSNSNDTTLNSQQANIVQLDQNNTIKARGNSNEDNIRFTKGTEFGKSALAQDGGVDGNNNSDASLKAELQFKQDLYQKRDELMDAMDSNRSPAEIRQKYSKLLLGIAQVKNDPNLKNAFRAEEIKSLNETKDEAKQHFRNQEHRDISKEGIENTDAQQVLNGQSEQTEDKDRSIYTVSNENTPSKRDGGVEGKNNSDASLKSELQFKQDLYQKRDELMDAMDSNRSPAEIRQKYSKLLLGIAQVKNDPNLKNAFRAEEIKSLNETKDEAKEHFRNEEVAELAR